MARVKKADVQAPALKTQEVHVEVMGGEVLVRQLGLSDFLTSNAQMVGLTQEQQVPVMLSWCVLDADGERLFTPDEWMAWANTGNVNAALELYKAAMALTWGEQEDATKNSPASPT